MTDDTDPRPPVVVLGVGAVLVDVGRAGLEAYAEWSAAEHERGRWHPEPGDHNPRLARYSDTQLLDAAATLGLVGAVAVDPAALDCAGACHPLARAA